MVVSYTPLHVTHQVGKHCIYPIDGEAIDEYKLWYENGKQMQSWQLERQYPHGWGQRSMCILFP